jgi:hypothetical protein
VQFFAQILRVRHGNPSRQRRQAAAFGESLTAAVCSALLPRQPVEDFRERRIKRHPIRLCKLARGFLKDILQTFVEFPSNYIDFLVAKLSER